MDAPSTSLCSEPAAQGTLKVAALDALPLLGDAMAQLNKRKSAYPFVGAARLGAA
jgi:hypothetical protein